MIITYRRPGVAPVDLAIDDKHCDRLLDFLSTFFQTPDAEAEKRYRLMVAEREAAAMVAAAVPEKNRNAAVSSKKRRGRS